MEVGQRLYAFLAYNMGDAERRSRFLLSSALWSVCGFPIAVSSRHFGSFIPPARQSGKSWQGRLKYWVMKIINQQPSVEFIFYFFFFFPCLRGMSSWGSISSRPRAAVWVLTSVQPRLLYPRDCYLFMLGFFRSRWLFTEMRGRLVLEVVPIRTVR